jgi:hypothetical protein
LTTTDEFVAADIPPNGDNVTQKPLASILDAPDYSEFVRQPKSARARQYEKKTASMIKAGMTYSIAVNRLDDAAACIHYGPSFAAAAGDFAAANETVAKTIDMICSPSSPALTFALTAIPLMGQFMRNHDAEIADIPAKRKAFKASRAERKAAAKDSPSVQFRIPIIGRTISLRMKLRTRLVGSFLTGFRRGTQDPESLTVKVFSDEKVQTALRKQGLDIRVVAGDDNA